MAPRATWKGYLKLSLVSCAVELFPATTTKERVAFHLLNRETGNRLRRQLVDPDTGEVVDSQHQAKGYEIGKRQYITIEEDEIDAVAIESTHTIEIESFVPRSEIDEIYLDAPYYLGPDGRVAEEAFGVIRDAMRERGVVGLGRVVLYRRERIVMLEPRDKGFIAQTLRYAYEVRDDNEIFEDIGDVKVSEDMLDLATHIIDRKLTSFDPTRFDDRYQNALLDLIKAKSGHKPAPKIEAPKPTNVVNLMDALRKSLETDKAEEKPAKKAATRASANAGASAKEAPAPVPATPARKPKAGRPAARSGTGRMRKAG